MFITKKKMEIMIAKEREKLNEEHIRNLKYNDLREDFQRSQRNLWDRMNELERRLDQRIDRLAELTLPEEEKRKCPCAPPVRF